MIIDLEVAKNVQPLIDLVDQEFWDRHPELEKRRLTRDDEETLRQEWNDLFQHYALEAVGTIRDSDPSGT